MVTVACSFVGRKARDDKIWFEFTNGAHSLQLQVVVVPFGPHLVHTFGIAEVQGIGKTLVSTIYTAGSTQLVLTNDP